jgi:hypothetical protein
MARTPHHLLGGVADLLGGVGQVEQSPQRRRVGVVTGGPQHPALEPLLHLVETILEVVDLGGQPGVAQDQRRVGQPHRHLGDVLHLHEQVDGSVELGQRPVSGRRRLPLRCVGQRSEHGDARPSALEEQHVAGNEHLVAVDGEKPVATTANGHD